MMHHLIDLLSPSIATPINPAAEQALLNSVTMPLDNAVTSIGDGAYPRGSNTTDLAPSSSTGGSITGDNEDTSRLLRRSRWLQ